MSTPIQPSSKPSSIIIALLVMLGIAFAAYWFEPSNAGQGGVGFWFSILPPLVAIGLVLVIRRLLLSMVLGVLVGGLLATGLTQDGFWAVSSLGTIASFNYLKTAVSDSWNLQVLAFIPFMLAMVSVMIVSGGFQALVTRISKWSLGRRATQLQTIFAGLILFFDDYANTMVVGSGMRPISDRQKISRAKLAFLVDATSAPIAGIAIMSTWIGYEIGLFREVATTLGIERDGFTMFLDALSFRFYCIMMIIFVFVNAMTGRDFGAMLSAERNIHTSPTGTDASAAVAIEVSPHENARHSLWSLTIPLVVLFSLMLLGFWQDGGGLKFADPLAIFSLSSWQTVLVQVENSITVLLWAAIAGFTTAVLLGVTRSAVPIAGMLRAIVHGIKLSLIPIGILSLAWALKGACDALSTGNFLVALVGSGFPPMLFPAILFLTAGITAFATGTSWGTMAILIPTAIPVAFALDQSEYALITIMSLGAVLDGAILGDHCSPISDTTIMSSTASGCNHLEHVKTQLPYALIVGLLAITVGYLPAALGMPAVISWVCAAVLIIGLHLLFGEHREDEPRRSLFKRYFGWANDAVSDKPENSGVSVKSPQIATRIEN